MRQALSVTLLAVAVASAETVTVGSAETVGMDPFCGN